MRRAVLEHLPALSHWFGLTPADLDDMWPAEINRYLRELKAIARAQRARRR